jgi:hypothetical protein
MCLLPKQLSHRSLEVSSSSKEYRSLSICSSWRNLYNPDSKDILACLSRLSYHPAFLCNSPSDSSGSILLLAAIIMAESGDSSSPVSPGNEFEDTLRVKLLGELSEALGDLLETVHAIIWACLHNGSQRQPLESGEWHPGPGIRDPAVGNHQMSRREATGGGSMYVYICMYPTGLRRFHVNLTSASSTYGAIEMGCQIQRCS